MNGSGLMETLADNRVDARFAIGVWPCSSRLQNVFACGSN
jgi:hypothetical protein